MEYLDPQTNEKYLPYCIEPSVGVGRLLLAIVSDAYEADVQEDGEVREVLHLIPQLAPFKVAVLPLVNKLNEKATEFYHDLRKVMATDYDTSGKIGKRYRRQDAIGTPYCVTVDFDTLEKGLVTVRDRDTMEQTTVKVEDLKAYLLTKVL
jgi:glycyl-tRNA synthetase